MAALNDLDAATRTRLLAEQLQGKGLAAERAKLFVQDGATGNWFIPAANAAPLPDQANAVPPARIPNPIQSSQVAGNSDSVHSANLCAPPLAETLHSVELAAAALAVLRAFIVVDRPGAKELTPYGSYEQWSALVRSALVWLGETDPCVTRELIEAVNPAKGRLLGILAAMAGDGRKSASEIVNSANESNSKLRDALAEALPRGIINARALGVYLSKHKLTIAGGYRLDAEKDTHDEVWRFSVVQMAAGDSIPF
jgi:hypothetical protein